LLIIGQANDGLATANPLPLIDQHIDDRRRHPCGDADRLFRLDETGCIDQLDRGSLFDGDGLHCAGLAGPQKIATPSKQQYRK
jgi:hypothetical protein